MTDREAPPVIRTPDQRLRVFVSSTLEELAQERAAARDAVVQLHLVPVMFELGARPHPPRDLYRAYLAQSHVFIGIYWQRYGWVAPGETISGLEDEYRLSADKPKLIYVKGPAPDREVRLTQLLDRVTSDDTVSYKSFRSARELRKLVKEDLMVLLCERFEAPTGPGLSTPRDNQPEFGAKGVPLTILFTDVEGSTDLRTRRGDDAAHEILRRHEALVRGCVADHGGWEVKALGDGFMIAFTSARKALACAIAVQQAVEGERLKSPDGSVRVRIGVNTGEVVEEGDDLYGQAVNAAARIAARAKAGEILVAEVTKQLVGSGPDFAFNDRGRLRLKGFPERWRLFELAWPQDDDEHAIVGRRGERTPYVGRDAERAELRHILEGAMSGTGALVMIGGEPGVGKTRLAEELMAEAAKRRFQVFAGHSYEMEGAAPYVAVVEILEAALARAPSPQAWREFLGEEAAEITRLIPKLRQLCPDIPPSLELPPEQERRLLYNSIRDVVERTASRCPLLLLFDDLQWADDPTLLCLEHLAEKVAELPVLIVATYRDTEVDVGRPLAKTFEDLRRRRLARWVILARLAEPEVARMLSALAGQEAPTGLVEAIYSETEGNPFFVEEVYRYLAEEGRLFDSAGQFRTDLSIRELDVPAGVRLVVGRRLQRLAGGTLPVLSAAAVVGRAFSVEVLEAMGGADPDAVLDAIEDAERASLIIPSPDPSGEDRFIFAHELIRQTLLADLSLTRRRRLHARTADALEHHYASSLDSQAAAIAHHLLEAGSAGDARRAFDYLIRAGRWAMGSAAFEDALGHFERASTARDAVEPAAQAAMLVDLALARRSTGHWDAAIDAWRESVDAYEQLGNADALGGASANAAFSLAFAFRHAEAMEIGQRGLVALGDRVSADRARLLAVLGVTLGFAGDYESATTMIDQAIAIGNQLEDDAVLGYAQMYKCVHHWGWLEHEDAVEAGLRAAELLRVSGDLFSVAAVVAFAALDLVHLGRLDDVRRLHQELMPLAERLGNQPAVLMARRATSMADFFESGNLDRLEAFGQADFDDCMRQGLPWVSQGWSWRGVAAFLRGDWETARARFEEAKRLELPGTLNGWDTGPLFECLAYLGSRAEALALLDEAEGALPEPGAPMGWGGWTVLLAAVEGLTILGDFDRVAGLYPLVVEGIRRSKSVSGGFYDGRLLQRAAGIAAATGRQWEAAEAHFRSALRQAAEVPHRIEEAHTRRWYGRMLLERNEPGDRERAEDVLHQAIEDYRRMGMPRHHELAAALLSAS